MLTNSLSPLSEGPTKNWIAVEGTQSTQYASLPKHLQPKSETNSNEQDDMKIASSAPRGPQTYEERNVFAIYVSYYVKVKLTLSGMGGEVSLKLPFILGHVDDGLNATNDTKSTDDKSDACGGSKSPTDIYEEECGQDDGGEADESKCLEVDSNASTNQCDTIQLDKQLNVSLLKGNNNNDKCMSRNQFGNYGDGDEDNNDDDDDDNDDDDDDDSNHETFPNVITAQIHHDNPLHTTPASPTTEPTTHSDDDKHTKTDS